MFQVEDEATHDNSNRPTKERTDRELFVAQAPKTKHTGRQTGRVSTSWLVSATPFCLYNFIYLAPGTYLV